MAKSKKYIQRIKAKKQKMGCIDFCDKNTNALNFAMINYIIEYMGRS